MFGSALAVLPLAMAAVAIPACFAALYGLTEITTVSVMVQYLAALIGLGVAIDYSLILVTRWREERDHGRDNHDAIVIAMENAGRAVVFSGITVAIGLLALVVLPVPFTAKHWDRWGAHSAGQRAHDPHAHPGRPGWDRPEGRLAQDQTRANRPAGPGAHGHGNVVRHRIIAAGVARGGARTLFASFLGIKIGLASSESLAKNGPAFTALHSPREQGVPTGALTPMEILVPSPPAPFGWRRQLTRLRSRSSCGRLRPDGGRPQHRRGDPDSLTTVNSSSIDPVRKVKAATTGLSGVIGVAGVGADQIDFLKAVYGNFPLMLAVIAVLTLILLARAFRSIVLPIKAVVLNLVTLSATLGFMVLFWQYGHGSNAIFGVDATGAVTFWIPLMVFAFLFGLSMDYEVFILSRIREEYDLGSTDGAVVEGIGRTGRLVTSAALILFLAFVALASGPGTDLKTFATALGFGILLDATIVRSMLVPALVSMFGNCELVAPAVGGPPAAPHPRAPRRPPGRPRPRAPPLLPGQANKREGTTVMTGISATGALIATGLHAAAGGSAGSAAPWPGPGRYSWPSSPSTYPPARPP